MGKISGPGLVMNQTTNDSTVDQYKTRGSGMIPVYRDRDKSIEGWACVKCGEKDNKASHNDGPHNGVCQCGKCLAIRLENIELVPCDFGGIWVEKSIGRKIYYPKGEKQ